MSLLQYDLDLEDSKPIFRMTLPVPDGAPPHQVWLQKVECFRRYHQDKSQTHCNFVTGSTMNSLQTVKSGKRSLDCHVTMFDIQYGASPERAGNI